MSANDAQRQREYKSRVRESGRRPMTVIVNDETAEAVHTIAQQRAVSAGRVVDELLADMGGRARGGKQDTAQLRQVFDLATSDAGLAAGSEFVRSMRGVALADAGAARRARKPGRRNGGGA